MEDYMMWMHCVKLIGAVTGHLQAYFTINKFRSVTEALTELE